MSGIVGQDPRGRSGIVNQFTDVGVNTALDSEWHSSMNAIQINSGSLSAHDSYPHYVQLLFRKILVRRGWTLAIRLVSIGSGMAHTSLKWHQPLLEIYRGQLR